MPAKSQSASDARKKAALREAVHQLLPRIIPVVREGGSIPLRAIVEAIGGEQIESKVRRAVDARGSLTFAAGKAGRTSFKNAGKATTLGLKSIKLKIPAQLGGWAEVVDGDQGVALHFDKKRTISACKMLVCADVEAVEMTKKRIFVDMEGKAFDRSIDLGAAPARKAKKPAPEVKEGGGAAPAREAKKPAPEVKEGGRAAPAREAKKPAPEVKEGGRAAPAREEKKPAPRRPSKAPRTAVTVTTRKEERARGGPKAALRGAVRDAKRNIRSGVEKTLKSAAESQWAGKQAMQKAARDAKTNIQSGVGKTRKSAAESREAAKEAARKARTSAREQLEHAGEPAHPRPRGPAARAKRRESRGGYLGLTTYPVRLPEKLAEKHGTTGGLIVLRVQPHGPADEAGLQLGDTLLTLGGSPMRKSADLKQQLSPDHVGQKLEATVVRAGRTRHVTVEVGAA